MFQCGFPLMFLNLKSDNGAVGKDMNCDSHGRVFRRDFLCIERPEITTYVDMAWRKLEIIGCMTLYVYTFAPSKCRPTRLFFVSLW